MSKTFVKMKYIYYIIEAIPELPLKILSKLSLSSADIVYLGHVCWKLMSV